MEADIQIHKTIKNIGSSPKPPTGNFRTYLKITCINTTIVNNAMRMVESLISIEVKYLSSKIKIFFILYPLFYFGDKKG